MICLDLIEPDTIKRSEYKTLPTSAAGFWNWINAPNVDEPIDVARGTKD